MKNILKIISLLLLFTLCLPIASCDKKKNTGAIVVAVCPDLPPLEYINTKDELAGFDIAFMTEIGKRLERKIIFKQYSFKEGLYAVKTGKADCMISAITVSDERLQDYNLSESYYTAQQCVLVQEDSKKIKSVKDLKGKKISTCENTTGDIIAGDIINYKNRDLVDSRESYDAAAIELVNKKVSASIVDSNIAEHLIKKYTNRIKIAEGDFFEPEYYVIAINKEDNELLNDINAQIKQIKSSERYQTLISRYFSEKWN